MISLQRVYFLFLIAFLFPSNSSAGNGRIVTLLPEKVTSDDINLFKYLILSYAKLSKNIDLKSLEDWNKLSASDFHQYDAILILDNAVGCDDESSIYHNARLSNLYELGIVLKDENVFLFSTEGTVDLDNMQSTSLNLLDAASAFSISREKPGAFIIIGKNYGTCPTAMKWLDIVFNAEESSSQFHMHVNMNGRVEEKYFVESFTHESFQCLDSALINTKGIHTVIDSYPLEFSPIAKIKREDGSSFVVLRETVKVKASFASRSTKTPKTKIYNKCNEDVSYVRTRKQVKKPTKIARQSKMWGRYQTKWTSRKHGKRVRAKNNH
ncbi:predicted protein [Chaetoceros tenuissimus]|uniref:Dolichyl-diphosphooligosaccharide--protein glycosyltransferase 48 kDa subunit n=1 Tax=Chaetoceros tenuissimus TaxID=426638 RepID=A0AAD3CLL4_9STRA|nr:predicted protein [Chaetoceros tenuissimus]